MVNFVVNGGKALRGKVRVSGNKNAILPILAASLLTDKDCVLENVPLISDVRVMCQILQELGVEVEGVGTHCLRINARNLKRYELDPLLVSKLRASILLMSPLLARLGRARMRHPGGCMVGRRAVGTHFDVIESLGAAVITGEENYEAKVKKLRAANIFLDECSVTATENALMLASVTPGKTVIEDAACEPHVEDLANFLNFMGANIKGAGTNIIEIDGVKKLNGCRFKVSPDYIDVGTFAIIAAATKGRLTISGAREKDLRMILLYLKRMGVKFEIHGEFLEVYPSNLVAPAGKIQTRPWPGFPTDLMSPLIVLATQCRGTTLCHDWMYEGRMFFIDKLIAMGANVTLCDPHRVLVSGPTNLRGKEVESPDIRAGMALVIAALCAQGKSVIKNIEIIERGYEKIQERLELIGADIRRIE